MQEFGRDSGVSHIVLELDQKQEELISINIHNVQVEFRVNSIFLDDVFTKLSRRKLTERAQSLYLLEDKTSGCEGRETSIRKQ